MGSIVIGAILIVIFVIVIIVMRGKSSYHEGGSATDQNELTQYGTPVRSLFTSAKVLTIHHKIEITDESDNVVYRVSSKAISIHDKTTIVDANDREIAFVTRKVISIHQIHHITMADGTQFDLSSEILHLLKEVFNIDALGWQLLGNILQLNFRITDNTGRVIAVIGSKVISVHNKLSIDIYDAAKEPYIVAIVITLQHILVDRANTEEAAEDATASAAIANSMNNR